MKNVQTDLVVEAHEDYMENKAEDAGGVESSVVNIGDIKKTIVKITSESAEKLLQKKRGNYVTIEFEKIDYMNDDQIDKLEEIVTDEIFLLLEKRKIGPDENVLVVGLGNKDITPDALGPLTVSKLEVTRHLFDVIPKLSKENFRPVSAISPGVLGSTGIETQEIIKAIIEKTKPSAVIAIDALASRSTTRLGRTIQLADTGICPGSGVGNKRKGLNFESLGIPVIALGVPTVVDAATVADDAIETAIVSIKNKLPDLSDLLDSFNADERYNFLRRSMGDEAADMMVTPKEIDSIMNKISSLLADGINCALQR